MIKFIDTHTHLYSEAFAEDRDQAMQRALDAGVEKLYLPAIDTNSTEAMYELKNKYPAHIGLMAGLHPTSVKPESYKAELDFVANELKEKPNTFCAVGEIGVDLYWDKTNLNIQQEAFRAQIKLAKQYKLPIVIHCRDAFDEVFEVLEEEKSDDLYGIFHCFTGTLAQAQKAISYNMKLGIGGVLTFKNGKIDKFLAEIPLTHIVLETDAPYLAPTPYRGKRNESSYLVLVAEKLASIYQTTLVEIANTTTQTAQEIFKNLN